MKNAADAVESSSFLQISTFRDTKSGLKHHNCQLGLQKCDKIKNPKLIQAKMTSKQNEKMERIK